MSEALWQERLSEARVRVHPDVTPETCAERYDVDDRESIEALTNAALREMFDSGYGVIALEDLDAAAEQLQVTA